MDKEFEHYLRNLLTDLKFLNSVNESTLSENYDEACRLISKLKEIRQDIKYRLDLPLSRNEY